MLMCTHSFIKKYSVKFLTQHIYNRIIITKRFIKNFRRDASLTRFPEESFAEFPLSESEFTIHPGMFKNTQWHPNETKEAGQMRKTTYVSSRIFLSATSLPVSLSLALQTTPYVPSPIFSIFTKLSITSPFPRSSSSRARGRCSSPARAVAPSLNDSVVDAVVDVRLPSRIDTRNFQDDRPQPFSSTEPFYRACLSTTGHVLRTIRMRYGGHFYFLGEMERESIAGIDGCQPARDRWSLTCVK